MTDDELGREVVGGVGFRILLLIFCEEAEVEESGRVGEEEGEEGTTFFVVGDVTLLRAGDGEDVGRDGDAEEYGESEWEEGVTIVPLLLLALPTRFDRSRSD